MNNGTLKAPIADRAPSQALDPPLSTSPTISGLLAQIATLTQQLDEQVRHNAAAFEFIGLIAHESRGHLTLLKGLLTYICESGDAEVQISLIKELGPRLLPQIDSLNQLIDLSLKAGEAADDRDLSVIAESAQRLHKQQYAEHGILLESEIPAETMARVKEAAIELAISTCLSNALTACLKRKEQEDDSYVPQVRIIAHTRRDTVVLKIVDNGCGIAPEDRKHLLKGRYSTRKGGGHGAGLLLAHKLLDKAMEVLEVSEGFVMQITLPRAAPHSEPAAP